MTMTVTPEPNSVPPRVRIDIDSDNPNKPFTVLSVKRNGRVLRAQPFIGNSMVTLYDYECPIGREVTYTADGSTAIVTKEHDEKWDSLSGWTVIAGVPTVEGSHFSGGSVKRDLAFPVLGRLVCQGLFWDSASNNGSATLYVGGLGVTGSGRNPTGLLSYFGAEVKVDGLRGPFTVTWDAAAAVLATATGTYVCARGGTPSLERLIASGQFVEDFVVYSTVNDTFAASATAKLELDEAWLIHPTFPSLSCSIDPGQHRFRDNGINVDATSKASKSRAARATRHQLVGRRRDVVISSGPRAAAEWELRLRTRRLADRDAVEDLVDDQSPLLLRSPPSWPWDLPDGWYSVGDYSEERPRANRLDAPDRLLTLPLTPVDPPAARLGSVWTYATDKLQNPTYGDSLNAFPTYRGRLTGDPE
jgi:hypothetical protein